MGFRFDVKALKSLITPDVKNFCRRSVCSKQQASAYLNDKMLPSIRTLEEISKGFDLTPDFFFKRI